MTSHANDDNELVQIKEETESPTLTTKKNATLFNNPKFSDVQLRLVLPPPYDPPVRALSCHRSILYKAGAFKALFDNDPSDRANPAASRKRRMYEETDRLEDGRASYSINCVNHVDMKCLEWVLRYCIYEDDPSTSPPPSVQFLLQATYHVQLHKAQEMATPLYTALLAATNRPPAPEDISAKKLRLIHSFIDPRGARLLPRANSDQLAAWCRGVLIALFSPDAIAAAATSSNSSSSNSSSNSSSSIQRDLVLLFGDVQYVVSGPLRKQFCALPFEAALLWLRSDALVTPSGGCENAVFHLLSMWINDRASCTPDQLDQLVDNVRVANLSLSYQMSVLPNMAWFASFASAQRKRQRDRALRMIVLARGSTSWDDCPAGWRLGARTCTQQVPGFHNVLPFIKDDTPPDTLDDFAKRPDGDDVIILKNFRIYENGFGLILRLVLARKPGSATCVARFELSSNNDVYTFECFVCVAGDLNGVAFECTLSSLHKWGYVIPYDTGVSGGSLEEAVKAVHASATLKQVELNIVAT
jgi:hypothetical protein